MVPFFYALLRKFFKIFLLCECGKGKQQLITPLYTLLQESTPPLFCHVFVFSGGVLLT